MTLPGANHVCCAVYEKPTDIPRPTGADLVRYAAVFVNVPRLWGGRAEFGFDCSGFTSTIYQVYGITLPRDAGPQAADGQGRPVDKSALQLADICTDAAFVTGLEKCRAAHAERFDLHRLGTASCGDCPQCASHAGPAGVTRAAHGGEVVDPLRPSPAADTQQPMA